MVWAIIGKWIFSCYSSWRLKRAQQKLDRIKLNNYRQSKGLPPIYTRCQQIKRWFVGLFQPCIIRLKKALCPCCLSDNQRSSVRERTFHEKIWINGTRENHIAKSLAGFIIGILLSILLWNSIHADPINIFAADSEDNFSKSILQKQREPSLAAQILTIITGICLTLALTISEATRCILVLAFTQFFTNKGRAALLAYSLILALSRPAKNTTTNMEVLAESLACGQDLLKNSILDLFSFVKEPFNSFQKAIGHIISSLQGVFGRLRDELEAVVEAVKEIIGVIQDIYASLKSIVNVCEYEFGTPYDRCMRSFEEAVDDCRYRLPNMMGFMCTSVDIFSGVCNFAKVTDAIMCWFPSLIKQHVFEPIVAHFKSFAAGFKKFFDARLNVTYKLDHHIERDKTFTQVFQAMKNDILGRCEWMFEYISWIDFTLMIPMTVIIFKALSYRWKFLNSDHYDNYYLSSSLIQMDIRRLAVGGESIFPLRNRELNLYVEASAVKKLNYCRSSANVEETFSWRMVKDERKQRKLSVTFVCIAAVQILSYIFIDYMLYKFMEWIRLNAAVEYQKWHDPLLGLQATVEGDGFLAAMYRSILENFNPMNFVLPSLDTRECLPVANKPNYNTYFWIVFLLLVSFLLALLEPYGLRLRHLICGWIYPYRVNERERWLYVHILTTRDSFLQFAKKTIRAKIGFGRKGNWKNAKGRRRGPKKTFDVSCKERLIHRFPLLTNCFDPTTIKCFICGTRGHYDDRENFIDCMECNTVYCKECLQDMNDQCVICSKAMDSELSSGMEDDNLTEDELEVYRREDEEKVRLLPTPKSAKAAKMKKKKQRRSRKR